MDFDANDNPRYEEALKIAKNRHDLSVINIYDPREREIPNVGLVRVKDSESGKFLWVDTSSKELRREYAKWGEDAFLKSKQLLRKYAVDNVSISTDQDYVKGLISFFKSRS